MVGNCRVILEPAGCGHAGGLGVTIGTDRRARCHIHVRAVAIGETSGFVKILIDTLSDRILGFTAFGVEASEMMAAVQTAMLGGLPYTVLRDAIFTHPTAAEGLVYLLASVPAKALQQSA